MIRYFSLYSSFFHRVGLFFVLSSLLLSCQDRGFNNRTESVSRLSSTETNSVNLTDQKGSDLFLGLFNDHDLDNNGKADKSISIASGVATLSMKFLASYKDKQKKVTKSTEKVSIDFYILLDSSGSMGTSIWGAKQNISAFLSQLNQNYQPRVTIMNFRAFENTPPVGVFGPSSDATELIKHLDGIHAPPGGQDEPGLIAVNMALDAIVKARQEEGGMKRIYAIVMVTDDPSYNADRTTDIEKTVGRFNKLEHPERIKFFASLNNQPVIDQYTKLFEGILTEIPKGKRGNIDLSFPFDEQAMMKIVPEIEILVEGPMEEVGCELQTVAVSPLSGDLSGDSYNFDASMLKVEGSGGKQLAHLSSLLKTNSVQNLKSSQVDINVAYCCQQTDSECENPKSRKITFQFE